MLEFFGAAENRVPHDHTHNNTFSTSIGFNGQTEIGTVKCEKIYEVCDGCGQKIRDKYLLRIAESSWHEHCLLCCICNISLNRRCYKKNTKIYCKTDYERLFGVKCDRCGSSVSSTDMVMRAQQYVFHVECFVCWICGQRLQKGEQYVIRSGRLFCRQDIENEYFLSQNCTSTDNYLMEETTRHKDGRRGPKRPRTILTSAQRRQFKSSFEVSPKPCRKIREALAKDTGLSVRVVQVWFQNQRAKMKKIQRKAKVDGDKTEDENTNKEKSIKQESPSSEYGMYLGLDGSYNSSSQPLNPNIPFSPEDYTVNSNDSFCSSDISLDGSNFDHLDEATSDTLSSHNIEVQSNLHGSSNACSHPHINNGPSGINNPIDKLYLMHNSYFDSDQ